MPTIAFVDDRKDNLETITGLIDLGLRRINASDTWGSVNTFPLENLNEYTSWITENEVSVLVLDERLNEASPPGRRPVKYNGHDVVDQVRRSFQTLPIFVITSFPDVDDLKQRFGAIEDIIARRDFRAAPMSSLGRKSTAPSFVDYVNRMVRVGTNFYEEHQAELAELGMLAQRIARGEASEADIEQAQALQTNLSIPFLVEPLTERQEWLSKFERQVSKLSELEGRIREHLRHHPDRTEGEHEVD
jgi:CheY-like chemotaxis protein